MIEAVRASMRNDVDAHIVVVPKQLTLQTERVLLIALHLKGSFQLQVYSPERLCGRIFESAGAPDGVRIDERGRVMLVRSTIRACGDRLRLYRGAEHRRGFPDRCARQLELIRQAGVSPERLAACAGHTALSVLVWYAFCEKKPRVLVLAIALHAVCDAPLGFLRYGAMETGLAEVLFAVFVAILGIVAFGYWRKMIWYIFRFVLGNTKVKSVHTSIPCFSFL